jgi:hypothetical protein
MSIRWTCRSIKPGSIVRPLVSITVASGWDLDLCGPCDLDDLVALDEDRGVVNRRCLIAIQQHAADEHELLRGRIAAGLQPFLCAERHG